MANPQRQLPAWMQPRAQAISVPAQPQEARANTAQGELVHASPLSAVDLYGDAVTTTVINTTVNTSLLALQRPPPGTRRTLLIVQNQLVGTTLWFAFGRGADAGLSSPGIPANGNLFLDQLSAIPQNELYLFFTIAGFASITYINAPIARVTS